MLRLFVLLIGSCLLPGTGFAGDKNPFRVEASNVEVNPGQSGVLTVTVRVPKEHHLYRDMMSVGVMTAEPVKVGDASFPPGFEKVDPADPSSVREQYDMDVLIEVPVTGPQEPGEYPVKLLVEYQGCKKSLCWMPQTDQVDATVKVVEKK